MIFQNKKFLITLSAIAATLSLLLAGAAGAGAYYQDRVLPRTTVGAAKIGSQPSIQAQAAIEQAVAAAQATPLTVTLDGTSSQVAPADLGLTFTGSSATQELITHQGQWNWLTPTFWRQFFATKKLAIGYTLDEQKFKIGLVEKLTASEIAVDAQIVSKDDGTLAVNEGKIGRSINMGKVRSDLVTYLSQGSGAVALEYEATQPQITTAEATRVKTEIENTIRPIQLSGDNKKFTLSVADQFSTITYQKNDETLAWKIDSDKLYALVTQKVSSKLEIAMVQRVIQSDTQAVTTEGKDGRSVDTKAISAKVLEAITNKTDTNASPIAISLTTVPFTDRWVDPTYRTDRFDGLYLEVNLKIQKIFVIQDHVKVNEWLISSGKPGTPTPEGQYYIMNKIEIAQSKLFPGLWMQKWNALTTTPGSYAGYDGFGLHRVPCFNKECTSRESQTHLGRPVSHGCIRIADEGADWVYDNAPVGTPVNVHY